jgi:DNA replication protein DnaC
MVKQSQLLRMLRDTYRDKAALDPVEACQGAGCLLLDEIGLSAGGKDELPLLHDVLDYRHGEKLPTIITGNVSPEQLRDIIGERLADRLKQSAFGILLFSGKSNRPAAKDRYFEAFA